MENSKAEFGSIDEYIAAFPQEIQALLQTLRATIKAAAPEAQERISYQMPTFTLNGNLVYFAAFKHHIGFYPVPNGVEAFKEELAHYQGAKGSVRFPLNEPLPLELISKIVEFRVRENLSKLAAKSTRKKPKKKVEEAEGA